jgi:hypothetical protein
MVQREAKPSNLLKGDLERNVKDNNSLRASVPVNLERGPLDLATLRAKSWNILLRQMPLLWIKKEWHRRHDFQVSYSIWHSEPLFHLKKITRETREGFLKRTTK